MESITAFNDFLRFYEQWPAGSTPRHEQIAEILEAAKEPHKAEWSRAPSRGGSWDDSWRNWRGKTLKLLVAHLATQALEAGGVNLAVATDSDLWGKGRNADLAPISRAIEVDFHPFGRCRPNVNLVVYDPASHRVVAALWCKTRTRERLPVLAYWRSKMRESSASPSVRVGLVTLDQDDGLRKDKRPFTKDQAIVNSDLDMTYVLAPEFFETPRVKRFATFADDAAEWRNSIMRSGWGGGG